MLDTPDHHRPKAATPIDSHIGTRIRHRRWMIGQNQQQLADACNIQFQQIQKYESGHNRVSASRLYQIATAHGVPVAWYFEGLDQSADIIGTDDDLMQTSRILSTVPDTLRPMIVALARAVEQQRAVQHG